LKRRDFIAGLCSAAVLSPQHGAAQTPGRMRRVGVLMHLPERSLEGQLRIITFRLALTMAGWSEDGNLQVDYRWTGGNRELADSHATELIGANPDVLVSGNSEVTLALQRATRTIPIVFAEVIDPVSYGLVAGLAHPGRNITGFMMFEASLAAKWLELLQSIKPDVTRVIVMYDPDEPPSKGFLAAIAQAAGPRGLQISSTAVSSASDIEQFFDNAGDPAGLGAIQLPGSIMARHRNLILAQAAARKLPMVYGLRDNPARGGLASYGVNSIDLYREAASYVDRILKGEKPADLPVQAASRHELVINMKTARALGLDLLPGLLGRADDVIE
jgi:putative ABC transport system substrate-binding protein